MAYIVNLPDGSTRTTTSQTMANAMAANSGGTVSSASSGGGSSSGSSSSSSGGSSSSPGSSSSSGSSSGAYDYGSSDWQAIFDKAYDGFVANNPQYAGGGSGYSDYLAQNPTGGGSADQSSDNYSGMFRTDGIVTPGTTQANNAGKEQIDPVTGQPTNNYVNAMGFAYVDKYGFPHVTQDYRTALQYMMPGTQAYNYQGNLGGGYALDQNFNRQMLDLPNAVPYGNEKTGNLVANDAGNMIVGGQGITPDYDPFLVAAMDALGSTSKENTETNADITNYMNRDTAVTSSNSKEPAQTGQSGGGAAGSGGVITDPLQAMVSALMTPGRVIPDYMSKYSNLPTTPTIPMIGANTPGIDTSQPAQTLSQMPTDINNAWQNRNDWR